MLVVDEGSLASTRQARDLLRIANRLRIPCVVLVGDEKQLDAVDAGKPFSQLQKAGMTTAVMDEIPRQKDPELRETVEASLEGDVKRAFEKLGDRVAEANPDNLAGAARWRRLSERERESTGVMAPSHELHREINGHSPGAARNSAELVQVQGLPVARRPRAESGACRVRHPPGRRSRHPNSRRHR